MTIENDSTILRVHEAIVDATMILWEAILDQYAEDNVNYSTEVNGFSRYRYDNGVAEARSLCRSWAPILEDFWCSLTDDERDQTVFDWDFVPAFVAVVSRRAEDPSPLTDGERREVLGRVGL